MRKQWEEEEEERLKQTPPPVKPKGNRMTSTVVKVFSLVYKCHKGHFVLPRLSSAWLGVPSSGRGPAAGFLSVPSWIFSSTGATQHAGKHNLPPRPALVWKIGVMVGLWSKFVLESG